MMSEMRMPYSVSSRAIPRFPPSLMLTSVVAMADRTAGGASAWWSYPPAASPPRTPQRVVGCRKDAAFCCVGVGRGKTHSQ